MWSKILEQQAPPSSADSMAELYQKHLSFTMLERLSRMINEQAIVSPLRVLRFIYQDLTSNETIRIRSFREGRVLRGCLREDPLHLDEPANRSRALFFYVWVPAKPRRTVICNGVSVAVSPNLDDASAELQPLGIAAIRWIETICINQGNVDETSQQVALMRQISEGAKFTILWLGNAWDGLPLARSATEKLAAASAAGRRARFERRTWWVR